VVKIIAQYFNPIESFEEKINFDEFQKFQRAKNLEFNVSKINSEPCKI
jgi:hypothetical protein